jgi:hypothetical protein
MEDDAENVPKDVVADDEADIAIIARRFTDTPRVELSNNQVVKPVRSTRFPLLTLFPES